MRFTIFLDDLDNDDVDDDGSLGGTDEVYSMIQ